jgi:hypothetical protein
LRVESIRQRKVDLGVGTTLQSKLPQPGQEIFQEPDAAEFSGRVLEILVGVAAVFNQRSPHSNSVV